MAKSHEENLVEYLEEKVTCPLCYERYQQPRSLPCLHTVCKPCLQGLTDKSLEQGEFSCPLCRLQVGLPSEGVTGFPLAFLQSGLAESLDKMNLVAEGAESASIHPQREEFPKAKQNKTKTPCKEHSKDLDLFCEQCMSQICSECSVTGHKSHSVVLLEKPVKTHKFRLRCRNAELEGKITKYNLRLEAADGELNTIEEQRAECLGYTNQLLRSLMQRLEKEVSEIIYAKCDAAHVEIQAMKKKLQMEKLQLESCVEHNNLVLEHGSAADVIKTSLEGVEHHSYLMSQTNEEVIDQNFTVRVEDVSGELHSPDVVRVEFGQEDDNEESDDNFVDAVELPDKNAAEARGMQTDEKQTPEMTYVPMIRESKVVESHYMKYDRPFVYCYGRNDHVLLIFQRKVNVNTVSCNKQTAISSKELDEGQIARCATFAPGRFYVAFNLNAGYIQEICENTGKFMNWIPVGFSREGTVDMTCVRSCKLLYLTSSEEERVYSVSLGEGEFPTVTTFASIKQHKELQKPTCIAANEKLIVVGCAGHVVALNTKSEIQFIHNTSPFTAADNILLDTRGNILLFYNKERQVIAVAANGEHLGCWNISSKHKMHQIIPHKPSFDANDQLIIVFIGQNQLDEYMYSVFYSYHNYKYFVKR